MELMSAADMSLKEISNLLRIAAISIGVHNSHRSALSIKNNTENSLYMSTGIPGLDVVLCGGLPVGRITELCGPPGIGKTQLCFNCCLATLLSEIKPRNTRDDNLNNLSKDLNLKVAVVYFDTELKFDPLRLKEITINHLYSNATYEDRNKAMAHAEQLLDHVIVRRPMSCSSLLQEVEELPTVVITNNVKLIVLESIAALAR